MLRRKCPPSVDEWLNGKLGGKTAFTKVDEVYEYMGAMGPSQICCLVALGMNNLVAVYIFLMPVFLLLLPEWKCDDVAANCTEAVLCSNNGSWQWANPQATLISRYNLQCDAGYAYLTSSLFFVPGAVVGLALSGYMSDRFGRRKTLLLSLGLSIVNTLGQILAPSFPVFLVWRTLTGVTCVGFQAVHMTYRDEFFPSSKRPLCNFLGVLLKVAGMLILAGVYHFSSDWRALNGASCILLLTCLLLCLVIPESPYWLLANGHEDQATLILLRMIKMNVGEEAAASCQDKIHLEMQKSTATESGNILTIIRDRTFLCITLKFFYQWFIVSLLFYGFYYSLEALSGSVTLNFVIMAVIEAPTCAVTAWQMSRFGRRNTLIFYLVMILVCCGASLLKVNLGNQWTIKRVMSIVGSKWGTNSVFIIVYLYTNEVMPTTIRSTGLHACSISARVGAVIAPYVVLAANNASYYHLNSIFIVLCAGGVLLTYGLPETLGTNLLNNLKSGEEEGHTTAGGKDLVIYNVEEEEEEKEKD